MKMASLIISLLVLGSCADSQGDRVLQTEQEYEGVLVPYFLDGAYLYRDSSGKKTILEGPFEFAEFYDGSSAEIKKDGFSYLINKRGEVISKKYEDIFRSAEGFRRVLLDNKYGYIKNDGSEVIPCKYTEAYDFSENLAYVIDGDLNGFINMGGKAILPMRYDTTYPYYAQQYIKNNICKIEDDGKIGYISIDKKELIKAQYEDGFDFDNGLTLVMSDLKYAIMDKSGDTILPFQFDYGLGYGDNACPVRIGEKWYIQLLDDTIDKSLNYDLVIPNNYNKNFIIKQNSKWGVVDRGGELILEPKYDFIECLGKTLYGIKEGDKWGVYDSSLNFITKPNFDNVKRGSEGFVFVKIKGDWMVCSSKGMLMTRGMP